MLQLEFAAESWPIAGSFTISRGSKTAADVVTVTLSDGTHVNKALVAGGWCWWYPKYAVSNKELKRLESEARDGKRGLWVDPYPVPPWEWRKPRN